MPMERYSTGVSSGKDRSAWVKRPYSTSASNASGNCPFSIR